MRLSELQRKDIINLNNGKKIGRIIDVELDSMNGNLINIVIETSKMFRNMFSSERDVTITFNQIKKLGEDVILVDITWIKLFFFVQ